MLERIVLGHSSAILQLHVFPLLQLRDLVHLDSAVCVKGARQHFVERCNTFGAERDLALNAIPIVLAWLATRRICPTTLHFQRSADDILLQAASTIASRLKFVAFYSTSNVTGPAYHAFLSSCSRLVNAKFEGQCVNLDDAAIEAMVAKNPGLDGLTFVMCGQLTHASLIAISQQGGNLRSAMLMNCGFTDTGVVALMQGCPNLHTIDLRGSKITDASVLAIAQHQRSLTSLNFSWSGSITDVGIIPLAQACSTLTHLNLENLRRITDAAVAAVAEGCPNLQVLELARCDQLKNPALQAIAAKCKNLRQLNLLCCSRVLASGVDEVVRALPQLRLLNLGHVWITDDTLLLIAETCPELEVLSISQARQVTDAAFIAAMHKLPKLQKLDIGACEGLTDASLYAIAQSCKNLRVLEMRKCEAFTDAAVRAVFDACKWLHKLDLMECKGISLQTKQYIDEYIDVIGAF